MLVILRSILLTVLFFISLAFFLILIFVRFNLLSPTFWISSFESNNIYPNLSLVLEKSLGQEGGNVKIDEKLIKTIFEENVYNVLDYINGSRTKLVFSIPGRVFDSSSQYWANLIKAKGSYVSIAFIISIFLFIVFICLTAKYAPGGLIVASVIVMLFIVYLIFVYKSSYQTFVSGSEPSQLFIAYVGPAIFNPILRLWAVISFIVFGLGIYFSIRYNHH